MPKVITAETRFNVEDVVAKGNKITWAQFVQESRRQDKARLIAVIFHPSNPKYAVDSTTNTAHKRICSLRGVSLEFYLLNESLALEAIAA
jgi:hypothetical protein